MAWLAPTECPYEKLVLHALADACSEEHNEFWLPRGPNDIIMFSYSLSDPEYHKAVKRLWEKGYLVLDRDKEKVRLELDGNPRRIIRAAPYKDMHRPTFVYLMKNTRNGYYKIGRSDNPKFREKTLQSEEPEVELLHVWPGTKLIEEGLHAEFSSCRVRGEWFNLEDSDLTCLVGMMNNPGAIWRASLQGQDV